MGVRDIQKEQMGLYEEHTSIVIEDGIGSDAFQRHRKTFIDGVSGPVTIERGTLHRLDCGHIIGSKGSQELLGICQSCGNSICCRCGARCSKCAKILCPSCAKTLDEEIFCEKCKRVTVCKQLVISLFRRVHDGLKE